MSSMQQMMAQAQKMQRELAKAQAELAKSEFEVTKGGAVTIAMLGDRSISKIEIDAEILQPESKDMLENLILIAINELLEAIKDEESEINERITGSKRGLL